VRWKTSSLNTFCSVECPGTVRCQNYSERRENRLWKEKKKSMLESYSKCLDGFNESSYEFHTL